MGGDLERIFLPTFETVPRTVLLVGRTGNGKSSTGNSIIGKEVFKAEMSFSGVTTNLDCKTAMFTDGKVLNVIDTPGLFDFHVGSEFIKNEIMKCVELVKDGIHAVILVISLRSRFTEEEAAAIQSLSTLFGPNITDYMIVLFTGDDCLKGMSQEDYLQQKTPRELKEVLRMCKNRTVFFNNETDDEDKKMLQLAKLLSLVEKVVEDNGGQPYTDSLFKEFKEAEKLQQQKEAMSASTEHSKQELIELTAKNQSSFDELLKRMTETIESKLRETNQRLTEQLSHEKEARLNAERMAQEAKRETNQRLSEQLAHEKEARLNAERMAQEAKREVEEKMQKLSLELTESVKSVEESKNREINKLRGDLQHTQQVAHDALHRCTIM